MSHEGKAGKHALRVLFASAVNAIGIPAGIALAVFFAAQAEAEVFRVRPGVTVSGEYNDNLFLTGTDQVRDTITRMMPFLYLEYATDFWNWNAEGAYDYRHYTEGSRDDETARRLAVSNRTEVVKHHVIVEMTDRYDRVSLDATRDYTAESSFINQSESNIFAIHPHIVLRQDASSSATAGYAYRNTWYKDPSAVDTESTAGYAEAMTRLTSRATFTAGVRRMRLTSDALTFDKFDIYAGPAYVYAPGSSLFLAGGRSRIDFGEGRRETRAFWSAGLLHRYSTVTVSIESGSDTIPDPLLVLRREDRASAAIRRETARTLVEISGSTADYRDPQSDRLENSVQRLGGRARHALTPRTWISLDLSEDRYKDYRNSTRHRLLSMGAKVEHRLTEQVTLAGEYRTAAFRSPGQAGDYDNNRWLIELTGRF